MAIDNQTRAEWIPPAPIPPDSTWKLLDDNPLVAAILYRRGLRTQDEASDFLHPNRLPPPDPSVLPNMAAAIARIQRAVANREMVGIFGDYDVDGITSSAILTLALSASLGPDKVVTRLPQRAEGYGLNDRAIAEFRAKGVSLVIAVDCGSSDHEHAAQVTAAGMDLVIFDHHHMPDAGPPTAITVSPQLNGDGAYHDLTAAGIAWLVARALAAEGVSIGDDAGSDASAYLDLAALGTIADVAPLVGANRQIVSGGLARIAGNPRPGLAALLQVAGVSPASVTAANVSFALAPRLNAAGRIDDPRLAYDLLLNTDPRQAAGQAALLEQVNMRRKARSAQVYDEAIAAIRGLRDWQDRPLFAISREGWESGLVGAVASRLAEEVGRPVFLFRREDGQLVGSGRSVEGLNLVESLRAAEPLLTRFGGHSLAAGVSLPEGNLGELEHLLAADIASSGIQVPMPRRIQIDARLPPDYLRLDTVRELARMEPFGRGNQQPTLLIEAADLVKYSTMGKDRTHLKLQVRSGNRLVEAVAWGAADRSRDLVMQRKVDLVGRLEINRWNDQDRLQLILDDFRPA